MARIHYDCDTQWRQMRASKPENPPNGIMVCAYPRKTTYGNAFGLAPYGDVVDQLIDPADYKEAIADCERDQIFPLYHQYNTWMPAGDQWNQNGLGYCWTWGLTASLMDAEAREGNRQADDPLLSPVSLGWLVGWKNRGNYLEDAIRGMTERGVCTQEYTPDIHSTNHRQYKNGWEYNALLHRLGPGEVWDLDNSKDERMVQHAVTCLCSGTPIYIAYNWWSHALQCTGVRFDTSVPHNVVWLIRNSHNENDVIELSGNRGVFDEAYGIRASRT